MLCKSNNWCLQKQLHALTNIHCFNLQSRLDSYFVWEVSLIPTVKEPLELLWSMKMITDVRLMLITLIMQSVRLFIECCLWQGRSIYVFKLWQKQFPQKSNMFSSLSSEQTHCSWPVIKGIKRELTEFWKTPFQSVTRHLKSVWPTPHPPRYSLRGPSNPLVLVPTVNAKALDNIPCPSHSANGVLGSSRANISQQTAVKTRLLQRRLKQPHLLEQIPSKPPHYLRRTPTGRWIMKCSQSFTDRTPCQRVCFSVVSVAGTRHFELKRTVSHRQTAPPQ